MKNKLCTGRIILPLLLLFAILVPGVKAARRGNGGNVMNCGSATSLDNLLTWTECVWVRFPNWTSSYGLVVKTQGAPYISQAVPLGGGDGTSGAVHVGVRYGGGFGEAKSVLTAASLSANVWYHICATLDDSGDKKARIYINGVEGSYSTQTAGGGSKNDDSGASLGVFGSVVDGGYFPGDLHHLTIWSGVILNQAEMMFHKAGGNPRPNLQVLNFLMIHGATGDESDLSPAKNNGAAGNLFVTVDTPPGWSLDFSR